MIYLEMSRDEAHGGGSWAFPNCVWSPSKTKDGGSWVFWEKILQVREGDTVIHLRGIHPDANFVGFSIASSDGFETTSQPPNRKESYQPSSFFRANLTEFTPFHQPINLSKIFLIRKKELEAYFEKNRNLGASKLRIFYVKQRGRLQCLNGAYFSEVDEELLNILFGDDTQIVAPSEGSSVVSISTGTQISTIRSRLGQSKFSSSIKELYNNHCCFPGCQVSDPRFLIGSHIARWSDNVKLRGELGNGLCFCLVHDKAFEMGLFSLDQQFKIFVNPKEATSNSIIVKEIQQHQGEQISLAPVRPLDDALLEHWIRTGIEP